MQRKLSATLVAAALTLVSLASLRVGAQADAPPIIPGPEERVVLAPHIVPENQYEAPWLASAAELGPLQLVKTSSLAGLVVQNAGSRPTRLVAFYAHHDPFRGPGEVSCLECGIVGAMCSDEQVGPGATFRFAPQGVFTPSAQAARTPGTIAAVFSVNTRPASDYGSDWSRRLVAMGYPASTSLDTVLCDEVRRRAINLSGEQACGFYSSLERALLTGEPVSELTDLPSGPFRGEPIGGVAQASDVDDLRFDRYRALSLSEVGGPHSASPVTYTYYAPGAHFATTDGLDSVLQVRNMGLECVDVDLDVYYSEAGTSLPRHSFRLSPWQKHEVRLAELWPITDTAAVRLVSDRPVASVLSTYGVTASMAHPALRQVEGTLEWALPVAFQEARSSASWSVRGGSGSGRGRTQVWGPALTDSPRRFDPLGVHGGLALQEPNLGWASYFAVLNPNPRDAQLTVRAQAADRSPRQISIPVDPQTQIMVPFRVGATAPSGGYGWGKLYTEVENVYAALESRLTGDGSPPYQAWAATAWPRVLDAPTAQVILVPDLGLISAGESAATPTLTETLLTRLAIQNLSQGEAKVAIDTYAGCGYAGTMSHTIEAGGNLLLAAEDLAAEVRSSNAAMVRVMQGEVALLVETRAGDDEGPEPARDRSTAYLGVPILGRPASQTAPTATLKVEPTALTVYLDEPTPAVVNVLSEEGPRRCMLYRVVSDAGWLSADPASGPVPGSFELVVDREGLGSGNRHEATLTITVDDPAVAGSPQKVHVTVYKGRPKIEIYLPFATDRA